MNKSEHVFFIMQFLKPEIKNSIILSAEKLFYRYGFSECPVREIADAAGITVSNVYKYFKDKDSLLDAVLRDYSLLYKKNFEAFLLHQAEAEFSSSLENSLIQGLFGSIQHERTKFVILMDKSSGTIYGKFRENMVNQIVSHIIGELYSGTEKEFACRLFAGNLVSNLVMVAKNYGSDEKALTSVSLIVRFYLNGIKSIG
jgi:AcrR family transcriptional regulator